MVPITDIWLAILVVLLVKSEIHKGSELTHSSMLLVAISTIQDACKNAEDVLKPMQPSVSFEDV